MRRTGDTGALRAEACRHLPLLTGWPGVIVLAVEDERRKAVTGQVRGLVLRLEQVGRHGDQAGGVVGEHALFEEGHDRVRDARRYRLRLEHAMPDLGDLVPQARCRRAVQVVEHEVDFLGARSR
jgi:hypothetical protein